MAELEEHGQETDIQKHFSKLISISRALTAIESERCTTRWKI